MSRRCYHCFHEAPGLEKCAYRGALAAGKELERSGVYDQE